jgi:hypothetical protein
LAKSFRPRGDLVGRTAEAEGNVALEIADQFSPLFNSEPRASNRPRQFIP